MVDNFWERMVKTDDPEGCWIWTGGKISEGYGWFRRQGKVQYAHRFAYESMVGLIPEGLDLHHICERKICVNPAHLVPLTRKEHVRLHPRERLRSKNTHCKHGHLFSAENTYIAKSSGSRLCRICSRESHGRWKARMKDRFCPDTTGGMK